MTQAATSTNKEAGFTLIEVMIAGTLSLLVLLPGYAMLKNTYRFADVVQSRFQQNAQARQVIELLGDGSAQFGVVANARGFAMVEGLRSRSAIPTGWTLRQSGQFTMTDSNNLVVSGDLVPSLTVQCSSAGVPIPDCTGAETRTVQGWLGRDPTLVTSSGQTVGVGISITDPFRAQRLAKPSSSGPVGAATENYRTMFGLNVEANP
jgi:type II secretory pathway component PulJ